MTTQKPLSPLFGESGFFVYLRNWWGGRGKSWWECEEGSRWRVQRDRKAEGEGGKVTLEVQRDRKEEGEDGKVTLESST